MSTLPEGQAPDKWPPLSPTGPAHLRLVQLVDQKDGHSIVPLRGAGLAIFITCYLAV